MGWLLSAPGGVGWTIGKKKGHLAGWLGAGWSQTVFSLSLAMGWVSARHLSSPPCSPSSRLAQASSHELGPKTARVEATKPLKKSSGVTFATFY